MIKRMIVMLILVGIVFGGIFEFQAFKAKIIKQVMAQLASPPQTVSTTKAAYQDWQPQLSAVGSLRAVNGADLSLEVGGVVDDIRFQSGDDVKSGQLLLHLRSDDDVAHLRSLEATAQLAQITWQRDQKQFAAQAVSQATLDTDEANLKNAKALVAQQQAIVDKKVLRAPFDGHLGIRAVDLGQYLNPGTAIVTLQALDPLYVDFYLPQQALDHLQIGQQVATKVDAFPDRSFGGELTAVNPRVDAASRNVQIRATLKNPERKLLPGMYVTVQIDTGAPQRYITLPQTAVTYNPYGSTVYLVTEKKGANGQTQLIAQQVFVTTGATRGDQVAVLTGVKENDTVVTAGQMKLRNGTVILVNNAVQPSSDAHPSPADQ